MRFGALNRSGSEEFLNRNNSLTGLHKQGLPVGLTSELSAEFQSFDVVRADIQKRN